MKDVAVFTKIPTCHNPRGLQAVSYGNEFCIATPHKVVGQVNVTWFSRQEQSNMDKSKDSEDSKTSSTSQHLQFKQLDTVIV